MSDKVNQLERILSAGTQPATIRENRNQDLSATATHVGSESIPQTVQYEDQSNTPAFWDNIIRGQSSFPNISGQHYLQAKPFNKTNLTENLMSSSKLAISPTEEEEFVDVGCHEQ